MLVREGYEVWWSRAGERYVTNGLAAVCRVGLKRNGRERSWREMGPVRPKRIYMGPHVSARRKIHHRKIRTLFVFI